MEVLRVIATAAHVRRSPRGVRHRAGLSTLELVLCLPLLLCVMALMVNFGTVACWKVRGSIVARDEAWRNRSGRGGFHLPRPAIWPATAQLGAASLGNAPALDHPALNQPVVRGQLPNGFVVNTRLLNPTVELLSGNSLLDRDLPLLPRLGRYRLDQHQVLLDTRWQYPSMTSLDGQHIPANRFRRIPFIYQLPKTDRALSSAFAAALDAIVGAPFRHELEPLDRDQEIRDWYGYYHEFHPRIQHFCSADRSLVQQEYVPELVQRIERLPRTMTNFFLGMYREQKAFYQSQLQSLQNRPGANQAQIAHLQALISELDKKIQQLQDFTDQLNQ